MAGECPANKPFRTRRASHGGDRAVAELREGEQWLGSLRGIDVTWLSAVHGDDQATAGLGVGETVADGGEHLRPGRADGGAGSQVGHGRGQNLAYISVLSTESHLRRPYDRPAHGHCHRDRAAGDHRDKSGGSHQGEPGAEAPVETRYADLLEALQKIL